MINLMQSYIPFKIIISISIITQIVQTYKYKSNLSWQSLKYC